MWIRVMMQQTVTSITGSRHFDSGVNYNSSQLISNVNTSAGVTPGVLYSLFHHTATLPSSSSPATAAATRIHLSAIGLISDYSRPWNATGESSGHLST